MHHILLKQYGGLGGKDAKRLENVNRSADPHLNMWPVCYIYTLCTLKYDMYDNTHTAYRRTSGSETVVRVPPGVLDAAAGGVPGLQKL